jgi:formylglycine-generating enzyme required for sulfatase activity
LTEQGILLIEANRPVEVEVGIRDYLSVIQTFQGGPNERRVWKVPLKQIPGPKDGETWSPPYFDIQMVWLESGEFRMGSPINEFRRLPNEDTTTTVVLKTGFWMGAYEVAQDVYERIMRENPSQFIGKDLPVDSVTWDQVNEFCQRLTIFEQDAGRIPVGWTYRLPTEAEWEYAARGGTNTPFSFGATATTKDGNFQGFYEPGKTGGDSTEERYGTLPVGTFNPNKLGFYDVHGNVAEWTLNRFWDRHPGGEVINPVNLNSGRGYTIKGGSWRDTADRVRSAAREGAPGSSVRNSLGFRIVLAPEAKSDEK